MMKLSLSPTKKRLLYWTLITAVPLAVIVALLACGKISQTTAGISFFILMLLVTCGNYRIMKKQKEVKTNGF
jgi:uncharacterized membrane protein YtjA (UPF0391 family)